jgi:hypothetical protein
MEHLAKYFGTFTAGSEGAVSTFKFEYLTSLGIAAIVIFLGRFLVSKSKFLQKYAIPAPVVSGLIFSVAIALIKGTGIMGFQFDVSVTKDLAQNIFFLAVGYGFSASLVNHAGGKLIFRIAFAACLLITLQNIVGIAIGKAVGLNPFLALQCSSASMSGGVGTAAAMGEKFLEMGAPANVTEVGVAAGTMGNIMGSLIGGPVAAFLISRYQLKSDPHDTPEAGSKEKTAILNDGRMIEAFALTLLIAALGMPIYFLLDNIPYIEMPKFIGCLFAGAIVRNILEAGKRDCYVKEMGAIEHMFLELYLALVLMTIDITKLVPVAGKMGIVLLAQAVLMTLFALFISFNLFGRNYGAAVMSAGNCGWGCGSGPNAVANTKAVMDVYGYHHIAWILYPSFAVIVDDIYNPIFLSLISNLFK